MGQKIISPEQLLDPKYLKLRLIYLSLFITAYELLKSTILDRIKEFFTEGFDEKGWKVGPRYKQELAKTGVDGVLGQSLEWLKGMEVINDSDIKSFQTLRDYRRKLVHEMPDMVGSFDMQNEADLLNRALELIEKIEVWWVRNVEIPTNPDFDGKEIEEKDISPGRVMFLQMIAQIALSEGAEAEIYLREFQKQKGKSR